MGNHTSSPAAKEIQFTIVTSKEDAQRALDAAEADDAYLEQCSENKTNTKARQGMNYHANRMTYRELKMFEIVLENARSQIPRRLKEDLKEVKLIQLMPSADGGMPHTRPGGLICYPDLSRFFTTSTLIHELWHLHQRAYESQWTTIFHGLGWKEWRGDLPSALNRHRRYNPDTIPSPLWIFQDQWVPVPVFTDLSTPRLRDIDLWFYDVHAGYHRKSVPEALRTRFPSLPPSGYEHPRELTAYMLSDPDTYTESPGFQALLLLVGHLSLIP